MNKNDLRQEIKGDLKAFSTKVEQEKLALIEKLFLQNYGRIEQANLERLDNSVHYNISTLGTYKALKNEAFLNTEQIAKKEGLNFNLCFPRITSWERSEMAFFKCNFIDLVQNTFKNVTLWEPPKSVIESCVPDIILVPGIGFSKTGNRLGRGKGFYDKYLESFNGLKVGICFKEQLRNEIPFEEHDQKMDFVITDKSFFDTRI